MFKASCPQCLKLSFTLAASCGFCQTEDRCWALPSPAFSLAHVQAPIQALICRVTDDQWTRWPTWLCQVGGDVHVTHVPIETHGRYMWNELMQLYLLEGTMKLPDTADIKRQCNSDPGSDLIGLHYHEAVVCFSLSLVPVVQLAAAIMMTLFNKAAEAAWWRWDL